MERATLFPRARWKSSGSIRFGENREISREINVEGSSVRTILVTINEAFRVLARLIKIVRAERRTRVVNQVHARPWTRCNFVAPRVRPAGSRESVQTRGDSIELAFPNQRAGFVADESRFPRVVVRELSELSDARIR